MTKGIWGVMACAALVWAGAARATPTPQQQCDNARITAWKVYTSCVDTVVARDARGAFFDWFAAFWRCRHAYFKNWTRFQTNASLTGSPCIGSRFTDNGDGTVTDNLTSLVWEKKTTADITEYPTTPNAWPVGITAGPDGNLWFTGSLIGKMTTDGVLTAYSTPTGNSAPQGITVGPDGNLWFTEVDGNNIGKVTTAGVFTEYPLPTAYSWPQQITAGPDVNLWFTETGGPRCAPGVGRIGRITPAGTITEYIIPTWNSFPEGITAGPDGNLWFMEGDARNVGKVTTAGLVTEYPLPAPIIGTSGTTVMDNTGASGITAGPDGNLWFADSTANSIGKVTTTGVVTEYLTPMGSSGPSGITVGPDGNLWFTETRAGNIGKVTTAGVVTEYSIPTAHSWPVGITAGPDGNLWFAEGENYLIGKVAPGVTSGLHDVGNPYTWSTGSPYAGNGTAFTGFVATVNGGGGFAGANGWRLPTVAELQTLLLDFACTGAGGERKCRCVPNPSQETQCIDGTFGRTQSYLNCYYWSATSSVRNPVRAWAVYFGPEDEFMGTVFTYTKNAGSYVRAVRGGW